jgi:hypothetical protein
LSQHRPPGRTLAALALTAALAGTALVSAPAAGAAAPRAHATAAQAKAKRARMALQRARLARRDRTAPRVSFAAPTAGRTVSGLLRGSACRVSAADNMGVAKVVFAVDGAAVGTDAASPYSCSWDSAASGDGRHTLRATAYDSAGNRSSASVSVTVRNATVPVAAPASAPAPAAAPAQSSPRTPAPAPVSAPATVPAQATAPVAAPALVPVAVAATTYYVSPTGSDSNSGTTPASPWRTVGRVNSAVLRPGDGVLFEGGQTFSDNTLMPDESGSTGTPIVFGSYGVGRAVLTQGVWFRSTNWLAFKDLAITGVSQGISASAGGTGSDHIVIQNVAIDHVSIGINSASGADDDWTIQNSVIDQTGDSGMILLGTGFLVSGNTVTNTGTDGSIPYGKHGIYLKAADARVVANTIRNFSANGVSARYRNSTIEGNTIDGGPIGIAWFQNDSVAGTSHWSGNQISNTTAASFYVSGSDDAGSTRESFVIAANTMSKRSGAYMDLQPTSGTYTVQGNVQL